MITHIEFCINHSTKIRKLGVLDARLSFEPGYNVLIGPNGAGKSTALNALAGCQFCTVEKDKDDVIKHITTETLNPHCGGAFASRESMMQGIRSMFCSHGQGVFDSLRNQVHRDETIVLIDSPETGQDHLNCLRIHKGLLAMAEQYQVIIATNNLVFMRGGNIIDIGENYLERYLYETRLLVSEFEQMLRCDTPKSSD